MAPSIFSGLTSFWNNIKEVDLRPIRQEALRGLSIAIVGVPGSGAEALVQQMRNDPARAGAVTDTPIQILSLEQVSEAGHADLIILLLDARLTDFSREKELARQWGHANQPVLVLVNQATAPGVIPDLRPWVSWDRRRVVYASISDTAALLKEFVPAVMDLLPDRLLALARNYPIFRVSVAHRLISDTCLSNASYSLSTGLAEIMPVLDIPLTLTDFVVLTKTQAFLVYRLGLALGLSTRWQDYIAEFGGVLGSGFLLRQLARSLIGMVPAWGLVPKVGVAYAGTYVVGGVVLQWYLTGRHVTGQQMNMLYSQAFASGKLLASNLIKRLPRPSLHLPRLPWPSHHPQPAEPAAAAAPTAPPGPPVPRFCPHCGKPRPADATFCAYCGQNLAKPPPAAGEEVLSE